MLTLLVSLALSAAAPAAVPAAVPGVWPLDAPHPVVHRFDPPELPWQPGHRGVDVRGSTGAAVRAALPGTVAFAGLVAGRGVVSVAHEDGTRTTYEPVAAGVEAGQEVAAGEVLGLLALAGSHCLPAACLHWGWVRDDPATGAEVYLNPLALVGSVRLLPLTR